MRGTSDLQKLQPPSRIKKQQWVRSPAISTATSFSGDRRPRRPPQRIQSPTAIEAPCCLDLLRGGNACFNTLTPNTNQAGRSLGGRPCASRAASPGAPAPSPKPPRPTVRQLLLRNSHNFSDCRMYVYESDVTDVLF